MSSNVDMFLVDGGAVSLCLFKQRYCEGKHGGGVWYLSTQWLAWCSVNLYRMSQYSVEGFKLLYLPAE